jgi:hypothetical protein
MAHLDADTESSSAESATESEGAKKSGAMSSRRKPEAGTAR